MRTIAWLTGIGTALAAGVYMIVSLNRWEWNRALFFGLIVLIAEVGMATGLVLRRLTRLERANREVLDPMLREVLRANRPPRQDRFAWLRESTSQMNVFITFLVGGGILTHGVAFLHHAIAEVAAHVAAASGLGGLARVVVSMSLDALVGIADALGYRAHVHLTLRRPKPSPGLDEDEGMALALEEVRAVRKARRPRRPA